MPEETLPLSVELRLDAACNAFEAAWKAAAAGDGRPRIEHYLAAADEADRWPLFADFRRSPTSLRCTHFLQRPAGFPRRLPATELRGASPP